MYVHLSPLASSSFHCSSTWETRKFIMQLWYLRELYIPQLIRKCQHLISVVVTALAELSYAVHAVSFADPKAQTTYQMGTLCKSKSKLHTVCKATVRYYFFPPRASIKENDLEWCLTSRLRYFKLCLNRLCRHSVVYSILCVVTSIIHITMYMVFAYIKVVW